jgi:hypothetical protein
LAWAYLGALAVIWLHCTHCHLKNMIWPKALQSVTGSKSI